MLKLALTPDPALFADAFDTPQTLISLRVNLSFSVAEGDILLAGRLDTELALECARCATPVTRKYSDTFDELYPDTVEYIDTRELIRETAALLAPLRVVCSEDCKGRCPLCGAELNKRTCACSTEKAMPFKALNALEKFSVKKNNKSPSDEGKSPRSEDKSGSK